MSYPSVDALQRVLAEEVFGHTQDAKKASGRALGTLVELITFYTLRAWGLRDDIVIERALPEFANKQITHNVEFSLHPVLKRAREVIGGLQPPVTTAKLHRTSVALGQLSKDGLTNSELVTSDGVLRNACVVAQESEQIYVANLNSIGPSGSLDVSICQLHSHPFAVFECKRVGMEGSQKGPQTIEKAKQGAYVARSISSLQKVRRRDGSIDGILERTDGRMVSKPYHELMQEVIGSEEAELLRDFILSVGVVSNHGNWFTTDNPNKELKVLAQSYDWLLFLTDPGLTQFIHDVVRGGSKSLAPARNAFLASYAADKKKNRFTKVQIDLEADRALRDYFTANEATVESWFNVLTPKNATLALLRQELTTLQGKRWEAILSR